MSAIDASAFVAAMQAFLTGFDTLDVRYQKHGEVHVIFRPSRSYEQLVLNVHLETRIARVASDACLPVTGWAPYAACAVRALAFCAHFGLVTRP